VYRAQDRQDHEVRCSPSAKLIGLLVMERLTSHSTQSPASTGLFYAQVPPAPTGGDGRGDGGYFLFNFKILQRGADGGDTLILENPIPDGSGTSAPRCKTVIMREKKVPTPPLISVGTVGT